MGEHGGFSPLCSQYFRQNTRGNSWRLVLLGCIEHGIQALPIGELPDEGHQAFHAGDLGLILSQRQSCEQTAILNLQWIYNYIYICNIYILFHIYIYIHHIHIVSIGYIIPSHIPFLTFHERVCARLQKRFINCFIVLLKNPYDTKGNQ